MIKYGIMVVFLLAFFCAGIYPAYSQAQIAPVLPQSQEIKTADVNKDGTPDVVYHREGKYTSKVEADTNYDGKYDITIYTKEGNFDSAEVDTDYDGQADKKFSDVKEFNQWVNEKRPDFEDQLNRPDWQFDLIKF